MLDVAVSYNRYKFLGYEFLTWLWFIIDKDPNYLTKIFQKSVTLQIGNRIKLENRRNKAVETITIKGDEAGLEEGMLALRKGASVTELNLIFEIDSQIWQLTVKGESLNIGSIKTPTTGAIEVKTDIESKTLEKSYLYGEAIRVLNNLYKDYLNVRLSADWTKKTVPKIKDWIYS